MIPVGRGGAHPFSFGGFSFFKGGEALIVVAGRAVEFASRVELFFTFCSCFRTDGA